MTSNKNGTVHLARFDKYWGGPAKIADVEFFYQPDAAVVLTAAKRGDVDIVPYLVPAHWPEQALAPGVAASLCHWRLRPRNIVTWCSALLSCRSIASKCDTPWRCLSIAKALRNLSFTGCAARRFGRFGPAAPCLARSWLRHRFIPAAASRLIGCCGLDRFR